jgi:hypothetical protein
VHLLWTNDVAAIFFYRIVDEVDKLISASIFDKHYFKIGVTVFSFEVVRVGVIQRKNIDMQRMRI